MKWYNQLLKMPSIPERYWKIIQFNYKSCSWFMIVETKFTVYGCKEKSLIIECSFCNMFADVFHVSNNIG
jgi:hypothetical protein